MECASTCSADNRLDFNRVPDARPGGDSGPERLRLRVLTGPGGQSGGAINHGVAQAHQGDSSSRAARASVMNRRRRRSQSMEQLRLRGHAASAAITRRSAAQSSTRTISICRTISAPPRPRRRSILTMPTNRAVIATIRISATGVLTPKSASRPTPTDEYSINYTTQSGREERAAHPQGQRCKAQRYWDWPYWDIAEPVVPIQTQIGERLLH